MRLLKFRKIKILLNHILMFAVVLNILSPCVSSANWTEYRPQTWMGDNYEKLKDKKLNDICISGSHDSGMSVKLGGTAFAMEANTLTQNHSIKEQLEKGVRMLDWRPVVGTAKGWRNNLGAGHYGDTGVSLVGWQGANGQSMEEVVSQINEFTKGKREIVIFNLSHFLNTNVGRNYRTFDKDDFKKLFNELHKLNHLISTNEFRSRKIVNTPLKDFLGEGHSAVILTFDGYTNLSKYAFDRNYFIMFDSYANSNDPNKVMEDQIYKMKLNSSKNYFLFSCIMTQSAAQSTTGIPAIRSDKFAGKINAKVSDILKNVDKSCFPNVISTDCSDEKLSEIAYKITKAVGT